MLTRQKTLLALLARAGRPLSATVLVKLVFLLRHETTLKEDRTFYDFVPYKYGPFSFGLYRDLDSLRRHGYLTADHEQVALRPQTLALAQGKAAELPAAVHEAVAAVVDRYGQLGHRSLLKSVYTRYPWYALNSELAGSWPTSSCRRSTAQPAVYTVGYEGKSVDAFFNELLKLGIEVIIDVRANPVSRKYGFSQKRLSAIAGKLGIEYRHAPSLGIPRKYRVNLRDYGSYQRLLDRYERELLAARGEDISEVARLVQQKPGVLVCVEKDVRCCHRSRLAPFVARASGLRVVHL